LREARTQLELYRRYTAPKMILSLRAEVIKARKMFDHETDDFRKSKEQLSYYRSLIERCTIRAPHDGFVIYANGPFREEQERARIEPGASVRQGQELFYFPDLSRMEVVAMLHDTIVERVRPGMPARVRVEGSRAVTMGGHVELVEGLPRRTFNDVPYYACRITLDVPPSGLLPGMSAEVEIQAGRRRDVLAVPSEALSVDHDRNVCYVIGPSGPERREITTGGSGPGRIEVTAGLKEGEYVVLNPTRVVDRPAGRAAPPTPDQPETAAVAEPRSSTWGDARRNDRRGPTSNDRVAPPGPAD
jgi:HlyD family secretion protein